MATTNSTKIDVQIHGRDGFYQFQLMTRKARQWADRHIDPNNLLDTPGAFYSDDTRCAMDIAQAMTTAGLAVR